MMQTRTETLDAIHRHGQQTYPEECCGFLLGEITNDDVRIFAVHPIENQSMDNRKRRYHISAGDYLEADRAAQQQQLDIVGIYHSHPDHLALPSATDLAKATFPGYTYVIVSIRNGKSADLTAWSLAEDRSRFDSERIVVEDLKTLNDQNK